MNLATTNLRELIKERNALFVYDSEGDLSAEANKAVDTKAKEIKRYLVDNKDVLPVDQMLEAIASLGGSPSVINDDNGYYTIGADGMQRLSPTLTPGFETQETEFQGTWFVEPGAWKETIREALYFYMNRWLIEKVAS